MLIEYSPDATYQTLKDTLAKVAENPEVQSLILFSCDDNAWQKPELDRILAEQSLPIMGGIFPQVVFAEQAFSSGFVVVGMSTHIEPVLIEGLEDNSVDFDEQLDLKIPESCEFSSMLVLVDGLSPRVAEFVESLFVTFGSDIGYIGGGAGSLSFQSKPCVLSNQGVFANAAVLGLMQKSIAIQVGHGWQPLDVGHTVTQVDKNIVKEIDYQNALTVYESVIQQHAPKLPAIDKHNFFSTAQSFPLGIKRAEGDYIVRDPIAIDDQGSLICVGELKVGDRIDILTAQPQDLIASMAEIAQKSAQETGDASHGVLLMDCISRALFLQERFTEELQVASHSFGKKVPLVGALVLGEIANSGTGYLEFYNKTSVIARF